LHFDASKYRDLVEGTTLSDKEKDEVLNELWNMMTQLVDATWNEEPQLRDRVPRASESPSDQSADAARHASDKIKR